MAADRALDKKRKLDAPIQIILDLEPYGSTPSSFEFV